MAGQSIYFDYAAATPLDERVAKAMAPYWSQKFYNPSALYVSARNVKKELDGARSQVAETLGAKKSEIIFTAGATESINLAIQGVAKKHRGKIIISAVEHEAVVAAAKATGHPVEVCPVKPNGMIDLLALGKLIDSKTVLVSVMYANNEIGTIQPIQKIAQLLAQQRANRKAKLPIYLHTDGSQAPNYLPLQVSRLGVDLMSLNGSKIYGPKQTGCLYAKSATEIEPLVVGGGQERGLRSGTENVPGFIGFGVALELASQIRQSESIRLTKLRDEALKTLVDRIEGVKLNGDSKLRLPNNLNISIKDASGELMVHYLDQRGVLVATGAACSANKDVSSAVLKAIGLSNDEINSSLRISFGRTTTQAHIKALVKNLVEVVGLLGGQ